MMLMFRLLVGIKYLFFILFDVERRDAKEEQKKISERNEKKRREKKIFEKFLS